MAQLPTEGELVVALNKAATSEGVNAKHYTDRAGYEVRIGKFVLSMSYDSAARALPPDPAYAKGWSKKVSGNGETWSKGDLRVSMSYTQQDTYPWQVGKSFGSGSSAWAIHCKCYDRDTAMAVAEALP